MVLSMETGKPSWHILGDLAMDASWLIAAYVKSTTAKLKDHGVDTWEEIHRETVWSLWWAFKGIHPELDSRNQPFPLGSRFAAKAGQSLHPKNIKLVVWDLPGDQEYFSLVLGMPHWNCNQFCWECDASRTNPAMMRNNFKPDCQWALKDPRVECVESSTNHPSEFQGSLAGALCMMFCM